MKVGDNIYKSSIFFVEEEPKLTVVKLQVKEVDKHFFATSEDMFAGWLKRFVGKGIIPRRGSEPGQKGIKAVLFTDQMPDTEDLQQLVEEITLHAIEKGKDYLTLEECMRLHHYICVSDEVESILRGT